MPSRASVKCGREDRAGLPSDDPAVAHSEGTSVLGTAAHLTTVPTKSTLDADRAALLLGGDPVTIAALATARGEGRDRLISGIAQPAWLPVRARLGLGVR
jgi:hypothetical protein